MPALLAIFFLSGFSALVYQVVWQRALFALFGINSESVTLIVTVFMLGLGLGSLAGGALSRHRRIEPILLFAGAEMIIGLFGLGSLALVQAVGRATLGWPLPAIALVILSLLLVPTLCMGATLPLLTTHLVRRWSNVGRAVSTLYAVNTLGSAAAAFVAAFALLGTFGQAGSVLVAAVGNLAVALAALVLWRRSPRKA